jgi:two-component system, NarL family, nitrate/nitrite response regulator NarL
MKRSTGVLLDDKRANILSRREREIALLVAQGLSNKAIAHELGVSYGTVKIHVHRVLQKLGAKSRYSLIIRSTSASAVT